MDPPPTAQPWRMVTCRKNRMLKNPRKPSLGRQTQRWMDQLVRGRLSGVQRPPISITATRYPFSASRRAETLPPKPEPMTMKSKSNWLLRGSIDSSSLGSRFLAIFLVIVLFTTYSLHFLLPANPCINHLPDPPQRLGAIREGLNARVQYLRAASLYIDRRKSAQVSP